MSSQDTTTLDPVAKRALLAKMLKQAAPDARHRHAPLSSAQHRLWFIDQLQPGQSTYTIAAALRLRGALDLTRLQAALDAIVVRHEPLRTRFTDHEGAVLQTIGAPAPVALETADIAEPALQDALAGFAARPFDLTKGPVLRAALFRMDNRHHVLAIAVHHIVADYHSLQVMIAEFTALYEGKTLPPLPLQFADYALAQRGHNRTGQVAFWQETLHGLAPVQDQPYLTRTSGDVGKAAQALQQSFDLADGPMWGAALCDHADGGQRLVVVTHHLLVDGVSWRILMADLQRLYSGLERGEAPTRRRSTPTGTWAAHLQDAAIFQTQRDYWQDVLSVPSAALPVDNPDGQNTEATAKRHETRLDSTLSQQVLQDVPAAYPVTSEELMLASLALALRDWTGQSATRIEMENHGRIGEDQIDLSGTAGWLTAIYPFVLSSPPDGVAHDALRSVKEALRTVPSGGMGYGVLRYLHNALPDTGTDIRFNYLGQAGAVLGADSLFQPADESAGPARAGANPCDTLLEINALATPDGLRIGWNYAGDMIATPTIEQLATDFTRHLIALVAHCLGGEDTGLSPVDFPDMDFAADDLDDLLQSL